MTAKVKELKSDLANLLVDVEDRGKMKLKEFKSILTDKIINLSKEELVILKNEKEVLLNDYMEASNLLIEMDDRYNIFNRMWSNKRFYLTKIKTLYHNDAEVIKNFNDVFWIKYRLERIVKLINKIVDVM